MLHPVAIDELQRSLFQVLPEQTFTWMPVICLATVCQLCAAGTGAAKPEAKPRRGLWLLNLSFCICACQVCVCVLAYVCRLISVVGVSEGGGCGGVKEAALGPSLSAPSPLASRANLCNFLSAGLAPMADCALLQCKRWHSLIAGIWTPSPSLLKNLSVDRNLRWVTSTPARLPINGWSPSRPPFSHWLFVSPAGST